MLYFDNTSDEIFDINIFLTAGFIIRNFTINCGLIYMDEMNKKQQFR